jgi:hypothetical protein
MLDLQQLHNNLSHKGGSHTLEPPSCEGLLCSCCDGVVQESNPILISQTQTNFKQHYSSAIILHLDKFAATRRVYS